MTRPGHGPAAAESAGARHARTDAATEADPGTDASSDQGAGQGAGQEAHGVSGSRGGEAAARRRALERIDAVAGRLSELSRKLHADPELSFAEHRAADRLAELMEEAGFTVRRGPCDLPTALIASYGSGPLTIGVCAEYDALPGIGHACGHNIICAASAGAAIGLAAVADELGFTVNLLGTPAEEAGGGKVLMLERGGFDGVTVAMMAHPGPADDVDPRSSTTTVARFAVTFTGRASHAALAPHLGVNAADAAVVAQVAVGQLRQQLPDGYRVSGIVRDGGERSNIIPERTVLEWEVRTPTAEELTTFRERVTACFRGAALATGCAVAIEPTQPDYLDVRNDAWLMARYADGLREAAGRSVPEPAGEPRRLGASTDMGNVSHALPAIHPHLGIIGSHGTPHTREFADWTGGEAADDAVLAAARAMAWAGIALATDEERRAHYLALRATGPHG
ncbi:amidohydrolase [Streptomyces zagrosensis]|uniref:Peptidase M20 domain-containing protein 2 n=1 Tax=Streptomyces zagrosensis TaxID=1042984 RepID=A0A7W9Q4N0_9ACTN|nr:amidohydrolase [Streptomyces zagrosensis]MBB5933560.1 amidohydrolase [Streptomyces zagrosensis]